LKNEKGSKLLRGGGLLLVFGGNVYNEFGDNGVAGADSYWDCYVIDGGLMR